MISSPVYFSPVIASIASPVVVIPLFETLTIVRTALSIRSDSVLPGTRGAGAGFIPRP
jgi:hypothetical protein